MQQNYDGDGLRAKKYDNGATTYYLRSSVFGGQAVAEIQLAPTGGGVLAREYVYLGGQLLAVRSPTKGSLKTYWMHEDPVTKSKRVTNILGSVVSTIELDPWGADTPRSNNVAFQPKKFTSYERDGNQSDEAMFRRYNRYHSRFDQPDPDDGSYSLTNPQSFNRYAYVQNDPVNFVDPSGLEMAIPGFCGADKSFEECFGGGGAGFWGGNAGGRGPRYDQNNNGIWDPYEPCILTDSCGSGLSFGFFLQDPLKGGPTRAEAERRDPQALFDKVKNACMDKAKATADAARKQYVDKFGNRIIKSMAIGAGTGAVRGGIAGFKGGALFGGLGAVGATVQGAVVGGIFGAAGGVFSGVAKEPFHRLWYDARTYARALNAADRDCTAEAAAAVANSQIGGTK